MKKLLLTIILAPTLAFGIIPLPTDELVINGDFEDFTDATGGPDKWRNVPGWDEDALDGSHLEIRNNVWAPNTGLYSCTLNGNSTDIVEQTLVTVPGEAYQLTFAWKPRRALVVNFPRQGVTVEFDGVAVFIDDVPSPGVDVPYTQVSLTVYATGTSTVLSFQNHILNADLTVGSVIDTVSVLPLSTVISEKIGDLADDVVDMNLQNGIENSLDAKLQSAIDALEDLNTNNDPQAADGKIQAFENSVEAQIGNKLTEAQGAYLLALAAEIRALLAEMP